MAKRVLCLLGSGFEEIETVAPIDLLRRAGAEVVVAAMTETKLVTGRSNITVQADAALSEIRPGDFDLLVIPGGPGVQGLREDGRAAELAAAFHRDGKIVAAICAGPTVLHDARLLEGKRFTAHFSVHEELKHALGGERVVEDGRIITSRGAGTAVEFGLALVRTLFGEKASDQIAQAIMA